MSFNERAMKFSATSRWIFGLQIVTQWSMTIHLVARPEPCSGHRFYRLWGRRPLQRPILGSYAGLWKVSFDRESVKGPILSGAQEVVFEARLNQNLDLKASFKMDKLGPMLARRVWGSERGVAWATA
jgi:hypothetical protein